MANAPYWKLKILPDDMPENPLEMDPDGRCFTFAGWHSRYKIGTEQPSEDPAEYLENLKAEHPDLIVLPVYLYDHSGVEYSTRAFSCGWDSGQVGWIWTTPARLEGFTGDAEEMLRAIVAEYSDWANGNVWGFRATQYVDCECCGASKETGEEDSCWGFIGGDDSTRDAIGEHLAPEVRVLLDKAWEDRFETQYQR